MNQFSLKANQIKHLTDARYFAAWNASYICFDVKLNMPELDIFKFREIANWVEGPEIVGTFDSTFPLDKIDYYKDALQLSKIELRGTIDDLKDREADLFQVIMEKDTTLSDLKVLADTQKVVVLDFITNDCFSKDWPIAESLEYFFYIDLPAEEMVELILSHNLKIQLIGSEEEQVGMKQFDELDDILEGVETLIFD